MYNKDLFEKICNLTCSFDELKDFVTAIDKKEFDLDNPFAKYYNVDRLIAAIEKYESKEIDEKYLAYWMNAYNWIIMGGFKFGQDDDTVSAKEYLIWQIVDWIDGLSFFDTGFDYDLEKYKTAFKVLDLVLQDIDKCKVVFAEYGWNEDDVVALVTNYAAKYFVKVYGRLDYNDNTILFEKIDLDDLTARAENLCKIGYQELKYTDWEYEDDD